MGDLGSIPGLGRSLGEGKGYPLQDSGLENSMESIGSQRVGHDWVTFTFSIHLPSSGTRKKGMACLASPKLQKEELTE